MKVYLLYAHYEYKDGYDTEVEVFSTKEKALERMQEITESYLNDFEATEDSDECEIEKQEDSISVYPKGCYGDYSVELWIKEDKVK